MKPLISIVCNTYNHEPYIRDAIEGFLMQKTEYSYEILLYDDASTDKTADIIREYEKKYPEIIKPIYQTVNQYSKGLRPGHQNRCRATGKYIALCEGDDYWIDENKLQEQISYMENHSDCTFCFTNGMVRNGETLSKKVIPWNKLSVIPKGKSDFNVGEINMIGYIPTASFIYRRDNSFPDVSSKVFSGDLFVESVMTNYGYAHFIDKPMVVYRRNVGNSATAEWSKDASIYAKQCDGFIALFEFLNEYTNYKYSDVFKMRICQWKIEKNYSLVNRKILKEIVKSGEIKYLNLGNLYCRINYNIKCRFPIFFKKIKKYYNNNLFLMFFQ